MSSATAPTERGCQCHLQLDPLPKGSPSWRNGSDSALDHYCHVCNTQLNSCKQTRIHVNGKRHEKRLIYLKYSLECETSRPSDSPPDENHSPPEYSVPYYGYEPYVLPSYEPSGSFYYSPPPAIVQQSGYYDYHASVPPPVILSHPSSPPQSMGLALHSTNPPHHHPNGGYGAINSSSGSSSHGVMSPSLTSGFSGSGADCKSTETSSILSAGSFSSNPPPVPAAKGSSSSLRSSSKKTQAKKFAEEESVLLKTLSKLVGKGLSCEVCQIAFPSKTVLENHLKGSRHNRKVKSRQVFRELQDSGAEFRHSEEEISCEVCKVSVNSSHQLQAHLAGQRHKVRCYRRGLHPSKALLSDFSSSSSTSSSSSSKKSPGRNISSSKEKVKSQSRSPQGSIVAAASSSSSRPTASDPPPLRLSLLGHPGSLKTDVSTSLMGAPPLPSTPSTTINLSVSNGRKAKHSKSNTNNNNINSSASSNPSRQKLYSQKQKYENEEKKVAVGGKGVCDSSESEEVSSSEQIPIPSPEPEKSKLSINSSIGENMIIPFKCESCQVTLASPAAPTPVS